jgi:hypothetical protein
MSPLDGSDACLNPSMAKILRRYDQLFELVHQAKIDLAAAWRKFTISIID